MTAFTIGMIAAALWLVAIVTLILLRRASPGAPSKSMYDFRKARRSLQPSGHSRPAVRLLSTEERSEWARPTLPAAPALSDEEFVLESAEITDIPKGEEEGEEEHEYIFDFTPSPESSAPKSSIADSSGEDLEVDRVIESITRASRPLPAKKEPPKPRRTRNSGTPTRIKKGPRKAAGVTYILIDEAGKPIL